MATMNTVVAAAMSRINSLSPHPPKTDKFSKINQVRETNPPPANTTILAGANVSSNFPTTSGATATAKIDPNTSVYTLTARLPDVDGALKNLSKKFATDESGDPNASLTPNYNTTSTEREPQHNTSGEKSADDTSAYFGENLGSG